MKNEYIFAEPIESVDQLKEMLTVGKYEFYHRTATNANGTPQVWRTNGQMKTFKRDKNRIRLPLKRGLHLYMAIESLDAFNRDLAISYRSSDI